MTEPTDEELSALWVENDTGPESEVHRRFGRAVLARWGTPPAVAGEPFAWADDGSLRAGSTATAHRVVTNETKKGMPKAAADSFSTPLYATPQPTQAQAGAVPLDSDDIRTYARNSLGDPAEEAGFFDGVRWAEEQHGIGIKGGQHGDDN